MLLLLSTLGWRMAAVTSFDYLPCFSSLLDRQGGGSDDGDDPTNVALKSIGFIFATVEADSGLDYKPSTMAAPSILAASYGALLTREALNKKMGSILPHCFIDMEHVHASYSMMVGSNPLQVVVVRSSNPLQAKLEAGNVKTIAIKKLSRRDSKATGSVPRR
ncbi:cyclin-D5-2-like [Lolium rigidum]|uniref:cyclin-D5-2-like n=1 Tax=Lolium rigidum TaxID=89674 RepID=UPI001F5C3D0F|nr:cyclin-D5-2-like [Lolium rigidum]